ncbi:hypothetical protein LMG33818_001668 [Halomonadaceae bacterium LMG 33818]
MYAITGVTSEGKAFLCQVVPLLIQLATVNRIGTILADIPWRNVGNLVITGVYTISGDTGSICNGHTIAVHGGVTVFQAIIVDGGAAGRNGTVITQIQVVCQAQFDVVAIMGNGQVLVGRSEVNSAARCHVAGPFRITIGTDVPALISRCIRGIGDIGGVIHTLISGIELRAINGIGAAIGDTSSRDIGDLTLIALGANTDDTAWISASILVGCTTDGAFGSRVGSSGG